MYKLFVISAIAKGCYLLEEENKITFARVGKLHIGSINATIFEIY